MSSDFPSMRISAHLLTVGTLLMSTAWTIVLTQTTVSVKGKKVQFDRDSLAVLTETVSIPRLTSVSACMWMKTTHTGAWTVISYAVARRDDEIRLSGLSDATLKLKIMDSSPSVVDHQLNDGQWHHLCMSWWSINGEWLLSQDGEEIGSGFEHKTGLSIAPHGVFIIGQEQDTMGGNFTRFQAFVGELTDFNLWDYGLTLSDIATNLVDGCAHGSLFSWGRDLLAVFNAVDITDDEGISQCGNIYYDNPIGPLLLVADHLTTALPSLSDSDSRVIYYNYSGQALYDRARTSGPNVPYKAVHREFLHNSEKMVLGFDYMDLIFFWSDPGHKAIYVADWVNGQRSFVHTGTSTTVEGIAVDWLTKHVYWTDAEYNWIKVANYNGTNHRTLITTGLDKPAGIVCDPIKGYLYWCDWGNENKIERATLSGESRTVLVGSDVLGTPVGLTLDLRYNMLYWSDEQNKKIMRLNLNDATPDPQVVVHEPDSFGRIFSMDIDYEFGFFANDREHDVIHLVPFDTNMDVLQISNNYDPNGLVYFDEARQPIEDFSCSSSPCSHMCVGDPSGYKCLCNHGYKLKNDGRRCEEDESIILDHELVFSVEGGYLCQVPANIGHEHLPETFTVSCFSDFTVNTIDFDVYGEYIFVHSKQYPGIQRSRLRYEDDNEWEHVTLEGDPSCISVDWIGSNLYWTSGKDETASIKVSTLEGEHVTTLISQDIREPKAIAVHATSMYLFWSDKGDSPRIERSDLRGRYRKVLVTENIEDPVQFAIDFNRDRLYWGDDGTKQIVSVDFDGYDRTLFRMFVHDSDVRFTGLTIFQDFMFVARYSEVSITIYEIESRQRVRVILPPTKPTTLKFFHSSLQPLDIGPCDTYIFCDEICVNTRYGAECLCSEDSRGCQTVYRCPLTFANGSVTDGCDNRDGNSCQYSCEKGYFPTTNQPIVCQENGEWEIPASSLCTPDGKCPRDFAHGSVTESCNNMIYNTCMYTCEDGFLPATTSAITCQESGVWDGDNDNICVSSTNGNDIPVGPVLLVADHLTTDMPRLTDADSRVIYYNYSGQALYDHARSNGPDVPYATLHREVLYESEKMVLSFDYQESILFWSDPGHKVIYKAQLKDDERSLVYTGTSSTVEGITVDWLTKHIYWTDAQYNWIKIANYDGTNHRTIITTGLDQPAGIVCDPIKGYLYWCDWGDDNKIEQSTLSGEGRIVLVAEADVGSDMLGTPVGLTLDMRSNVLYWSDEKNKKIMRLTLNAGTLTPQVVVNEPDTFGQIFSLDIDYNFGFFASDREHDLVHLVPFDTSKDVLQVSTSYDPNGLVYFDEARQPIEDFACSSSPCSHICVGDPNGYKCLCNHGYKLKSDRRRCEEDESIILDHELVFSAEGGYLCQIPANIGHEHLPETFTVSCFTDFTVNTLDFDVYAEYIFVHSEEHGGIQRARLRYDNNHWQDIILGGQVSDLSVDWIGSNLYWTLITDTQSSINVATLLGDHVATLVSQDTPEAKAIAVHATKMYLFWSNSGEYPLIERSDLHGRHRIVIASEGIVNPTQLAIDFNKDRIYWADDGEKKIISVDFDGNNRENFIFYTSEDKTEFSGLTIFQDFLFVARYDAKKISIYEIGSHDHIRSIYVESKITALTFFHKSIQPLSNAPCDLYGTCGGICINTIHGTECLCSEDIPECLTVYRCPLTFNGGSVLGACDNRDGNSCIYSCDAGYFATTKQSVMCQENGEWNIPTESLCNRDGTCPTVFAHGSVKQPCSNTQGSKCAITCDEGYVSQTTDEVVCEKNAVWGTDNDKLCISDIDPCVLLPCQHDGACRNDGNTYVCTCATGWEGPDCEIASDDGNSDKHTSNHAKGPNILAIVLPTVGVVVIVCVILLTAFICRRRFRKNPDMNPQIVFSNADIPTDVEGAVTGIPNPLFPNNPALNNANAAIGIDNPLYDNVNLTPANVDPFDSGVASGETVDPTNVKIPPEDDALAARFVDMPTGGVTNRNYEELQPQPKIDNVEKQLNVLQLKDEADA